MRKEFPDWFINSLLYEEDKKRAYDNTLGIYDMLSFICPRGHITKCKLSSKLRVKDMSLRGSLCPVCHRETKIQKYKSTLAKQRVYPEWFINELVYDEDRQKALNKTLRGDDIVTFRCSEGHIYSKKVEFRIKKDGTPRCGCKQCHVESFKQYSKPSFHYPDWFINELVDEDDREFAKIGKLPLTKKVKIKCPICSHEYLRYVRLEINIKTGERKRTCPKCMLKIKEYNHKKHTLAYPQWFIDQIVDDSVKNKAKENTLLSNEIVTLRCDKGHIFNRRVSNYISLTKMNQRTECPICKKEKRHINESSHRKYPTWFIDELYKPSDKEKASKGVLKTTDTVPFVCSTCQTVYYSRVGDHISLKTLRKKSGCPVCGENLRHIKRKETLSSYREYPQWFIDELACEEDKKRALNKTLTSNDCVEFLCSKGHLYHQMVGAHLSLSTGKKKADCPICHARRSQVEIEIEQYIKDLGFSTEHTYFKSTDRKFEIDIYIPEKKIGIEYNGSYFHKTLPKDKNSKEKFYHNNKYYACKDLGIRLISIFEPDWSVRKEKVQQYLRDLLLPTKEKVYARNTKIIPIDSHTANLMYENYHLLGKTTVQQVSYGLMYDGQLISCMSFQKGRYKDNNEATWCLTRFVTKSDYVVIGGASKLLNQFEKDYKPSVIISYSDNDYFDGNVYNKLGFTCMGDTKSPRYFWWLENTEYKREVCQLKNLAKRYPDLYEESKHVAGNKEDYIMLRLGAYKVYRSGHTKWVKKY